VDRSGSAGSLAVGRVAPSAELGLRWPEGRGYTAAPMAAPYVHPKVSVIVPIYNQAPFIRETVESVLAQDYANVELVLSDDGSTDGTADILREYAEREPSLVRLVASAKNTGIAGAFNRALDAHTGEYIAWLGGDDVMLPGKLSRQVALLEARPEVSGCCHDAEVFDSDSGRLYGRFTEVYNGRRGVRDGGVELLLDPAYLMLPSTMMVRSRAVGRLRFDQRVRVSNDWLFDIVLFRHGRIAGLDDVLARYRRHQRNATSQTADALEDALVVLALAEARYPELNRLIRRRRIASIFGEASRRLGAGDRRAALRYIAAAAGTGGVLRALRVGLRLVGVELGRRRLGVNVPR
jgi:glycosyltransferase involved in cell wall biosynthesis